MLPVPWVGQWGQSANRYRNDCGVASLLMCLEYFGIRGNLTVDALATETALASADAGLTCQQLVDCAARHGLSASVHWHTVVDDLRREIDALRPVIALVNYGYINNRLDQQFRGWHFFVVVGYDDEHFVVNDPDYWSPYTERGHDVLIPVREIEAAMVGYSGQCVFMENPMSIPDQISAYAEQIKTLAAQIDDTPAPLPGVEMVTTANLNVRTAPVTGAVVATLLTGDVVRVVPAAPEPWRQIVVGVYSGRFVSGAYLAPK